MRETKKNPQRTAIQLDFLLINAPNEGESQVLKVGEMESGGGNCRTRISEFRWRDS